MYYINNILYNNKKKQKKMQKKKTGRINIRLILFLGGGPGEKNILTYLILSNSGSKPTVQSVEEDNQVE